MSRFADEKQVVCLFVFKGGEGGNHLKIVKFC